MQTNSDTPETDALLVCRALAGDRLAANRLSERHRRSLLALAYRTLQNADDAQDVAQEALVYALQRLPDLREADKFASWLRHITLSLCADYRRRRGTRSLGEPVTVWNEAREEVNYVEMFTLRQAMADLSDAHRTTLLLHYVGGWSLEETAAILEIPVNTVRSRLMAAKRNLRAELPGFFPETTYPQGKIMPVNTFGLSEIQLSLLDIAFPSARIISVKNDPEPWMPFSPRVRLVLKDGLEKTVDFRADISSAHAELLPVLECLGIPGPRLIPGAVAEGPNGPLRLAEVPRGENLSLWTLGGTPHRIRLATERAFEGIDRLQGITEALRADPLGAKLPRRTLADEIAILTDDDKWNADWWLAEEGHARVAWLQDPWFTDALTKVQAAIADIHDPLVYTYYGHFFPQNYRIMPDADPFKEPLGAPGDPAYQKNPLVEFIGSFSAGHYGDPLLGLAMVWVYDCYPFVHTGFVEQFLWRRGVSKREFGPRLALKALQMIARDLPLECPSEGGGYWDGLHGWAEQGLDWL
jgi:RNA polymerase sigma factor (sigma-70 family)